MLKVFQIYFDKSQLAGCDYTPHLNDDCTVFFENSVIKKLIENNSHHGFNYFGVVSWKLREKILITKTSWRNHRNIANLSNNQFTPSDFERHLFSVKPDVMSFQRHPGHDTVSFADTFHPGFSKYFREIMEKIGYHWKPTSFNDVFYCNYFVAKSPWYERYVTEMLAPAMEVMKQMPELMKNSRYPHSLPDDLQKKFGITHYPYHPFLCERMFSYYAHIHNLKCLHY
jgi:hypothetical protein